MVGILSAFDLAHQAARTIDNARYLRDIANKGIVPRYPIRAFDAAGFGGIEENLANYLQQGRRLYQTGRLYRRA